MYPAALGYDAAVTPAPTLDVAVILPAAGSGSRMGQAGGVSKVELPLAGRPVFAHALQRFLACPEVLEVLVAVPPGTEAAFSARHSFFLSDPRVRVVAGSPEGRFATVQAALGMVSPLATHIAVHDAARPLVPAALLRGVWAAVSKHAAVVPVLPVADTLRRQPEPTVPLGAVVPREGLVGVQTPQVFEAQLLRRAYAALVELPPAERQAITDDAMLVERLGTPVHAVPGHPANLKLTRPADAELLEALARGESAGQP